MLPLGDPERRHILVSPRSKKLSLVSIGAHQTERSKTSSARWTADLAFNSVSDMIFEGYTCALRTNITAFVVALPLLFLRVGT